MFRGNKWLCLMLSLCTAFDMGMVSSEPQANKLRLVHQWSQLDFEYSSQSEREADIQSGTWIPEKPAPIDVDVYYGRNTKKIFVTIPRFQAGIPAALGTVVSEQKGGSNPLIRPYPNWSWHKNPSSCSHDRIVSVYRVQIDECGRLWVLDTGRLLEEQTCPPQILAFDLKTDKLVHRHEIDSSLLESRSILVTPTVDIRDAHQQCRDTFVYVADCQTYSIIVHDVRRNKSWRVSDKTMYPYPNYGTFSIMGDSFDLMDGILGMALEPYRDGLDRKLFYHAMSSPTENYVYTSQLKNESRFIHDPTSSPEIFYVYPQGRDTQCAAEAMDRNGVMFFGLMSPVTINCWNTDKDYGLNNIDVVDDNREKNQFASGIKIITNSNTGHQELWVMTSRFQKVATGTLESNDMNFRIQAGKVDDLVYSSKCKHRQNGGHAHHEHPHGNAQGGGYGLLKPSRNRALHSYSNY